MTLYRRNKSALPDVESDGEFLKPLKIEGCFETNETWYKGLSQWQRLNSHQTYSSVRRHVNFRPFRVVKDHLDYILTATYQHNKELFPNSCDVHIQPTTVEHSNRQQHKAENVKPDGKDISKYPYKFNGDDTMESVSPRRLHPDRRLIIGGIKERMHPSSIKLMNTSHHSPQTNAGYVRQDRDGNLFQY